MTAAPSMVEPRDQVERLNGLVESLTTQNLRLEHALRSRIVIEQAKGVLAERYEIGVSEAFDLMRRASRANRLRIHVLAARVVASRETPAEIAAVLAQGAQGSR